jgi:crotonobetainyl-CoA:carnitine CoA-transferase CaiB-like acyl-CoA transferase
MAGLLDGIKVVSMGQVVAVPSASSIMADWGAEVIKLESLSGDLQRGTTKVHGADSRNFGINWTVQALNRNAKGLALDLKQEAGRDILYKLIGKADVFTTNYETNSVKKLKLDYATLSQINPKLIYASINGYGTKGPDKDEKGYDFSAGWARSGMMELIGEPGSPPAPQRGGMIDSVAGAHMVAGICAALLRREKTGKGQELSVSLYQTSVWTLSLDIQIALSGVTPLKHDRTKAVNPIWNSYRTGDNRWFWLAMFQADVDWPNFCRAIERPELAADPRYSTMDSRAQHCEELIQIIDKVLGSQTMAEWEKRFREHKVIYGRVQTPMEVVNDPQALSNDFFVDVDFPGVGKKKLIASPVVFRQDPASVRAPAPELGQHTEDILLELGYSWEDIGRLKEQKVIL